MKTLAAAMFLALAGCVATPDSYPIPPQHEPVTGPEPLTYRDYVKAADPLAEAFFARDIRGLEGHFRWTAANPELRFTLETTERLHFQLEYGVHPVLLKDVGPLELTIEVNGNALATFRDAAPGDKTFRKRVPAEWLKADAENIVSIRVHNPWLTPDKSYLGFVFLGAGFVE